MMILLAVLYTELGLDKVLIILESWARYVNIGSEDVFVCCSVSLLLTLKEYW